MKLELSNNAKVEQILQKRPDLSERTRDRKLYREYLTKFSCMIKDDESYVLEDFRQLSGMCFYTAMQRKEHFRTEKKPSFPKNIWFGRQFAVVVEQAKASSLPKR